MRTIINVLSVMSLSGTLAFLFWLIAYGLYFLEFKAKWLRNLNMLVIPFFLFPLPLFRYLFCKLFLDTGIMPASLARDIEGVIDKTYMIVNQENTFIFSACQKILLTASTCMAFISLLYIALQCNRYFKLRHAIRNNLILPLSKQEVWQFNKTKKQMQITQDVLFIKSSRVSGPFTFGIFHPVIVIPDDLPKTKKALHMVLGHEFAHIRHKDSFFSLIVCIMLAMHWYNIFYYFFLYFFKMCNELYSDETTLEMLPDVEKFAYCELLIELSRRKNILSDLFTLSFMGNASKQIQRRIDKIMKGKKCKFGMAVAIGSIMLSLGLGSTFAYAGANEMQIESGDTFSYKSEEEFLLETSISANTPYEDYFIDENGIQYPCEDIETRAICIHEYVNGTRRVHTKVGNGCRRDYYHAKRCIICGKIVSYDKYYTESWVTCPHE